jgi:hypothetical protein
MQEMRLTEHPLSAAEERHSMELVTGRLYFIQAAKCAKITLKFEVVPVFTQTQMYAYVYCVLQ